MINQVSVRKPPEDGFQRLPRNERLLGMSGLLSVSVAGKDFSGSIVTSEHLVMDFELPPNTKKIF